MPMLISNVKVGYPNYHGKYKLFYANKSAIEYLVSGKNILLYYKTLSVFCKLPFRFDYRLHYLHYGINLTFAQKPKKASY